MRKDVKTLCPYCGVGCGLIATTDGERVLRVRGDPKHPANFGRVCSKGGSVARTLNVSSRLRHPMTRERSGDAFAITPVPAAIQHVARGLEKILQSHGPGAIGFYLSGQLTPESQYIANKFAKAYLRTNHVDSNSRLCMSSAATAMSLSLGSDGPPTVYADIELADAFLFVGSNAADCHPVTFERIVARINKGKARCVVLDPRRTATAEAATLHLPLRPGSDLSLLNGLLRLFRDWGKVDRAFVEAHTEGWAELSRLLDEYPPARVATDTGLAESQIHAAARMLAGAERLITFWTMGVNQSVAGTHTANAIINLHLATGRIGKPGAGPFSLTGQPNAMGGRDCGYMSHTLPGFRRVDNADDRRQMESAWGLSPGTIRPEPGHDVVRMFEAPEAGELKALWIIGSNPAATMPNLEKVRRSIASAELVVVQDAYFPTETAKLAHVVLPAAVNFEQDGTFCNSERRVTLMEQVVPAPGEAMPDWWWVRQVAAEMGFTRGLKFQNAAEIFDEFARVTAGRPNDQSGMHHAMLRERGPQLWPHPALGQEVERRYTDHVFPTPSGKARLLARPHLPREESPCREFPLVLTTGRTLNQWHMRTKTGLVAQLNRLDPAPYLQIHPDDALELALVDGEPVEIQSRRGAARSVVRIDERIAAGTVFMPMHWGNLWGEGASPNEVTSDAVDPLSKQPSLKYCAVNVRPLRKPATEPAEANKHLETLLVVATP